MRILWTQKMASFNLAIAFSTAAIAAQCIAFNQHLRLHLSSPRHQPQRHRLNWSSDCFSWFLSSQLLRHPFSSLQQTPHNLSAHPAKSSILTSSNLGLGSLKDFMLNKSSAGYFIHHETRRTKLMQFQADVEWSRLHQYGHLAPTPSIETTLWLGRRTDLSLNSLSPGLMLHQQ